MVERGYAEQARHYREVARDRGCVCPDGLAPHVHLIECPLYHTPTVPAALHRHGVFLDVERIVGHQLSVEDRRELHEALDQAHDADEGRPWL